METAAQSLLVFLPFVSVLLLTYIALRLCHLEKTIIAALDCPERSFALSGKQRAVLVLVGILVVSSFAVSVLGYVVNVVLIHS